MESSWACTCPRPEAGYQCCAGGARPGLSQWTPLRLWSCYCAPPALTTSQEVQRRIASGAFEGPARRPALRGHRHSAAAAVAADTAYRPQDLRAVPPAPSTTPAVAACSPWAGPPATPSGSGSAGGAAGLAAQEAAGSGRGSAPDWELLLAVGSALAAEARAAVLAEAGYCSSAGAPRVVQLAGWLAGWQAGLPAGRLACRLAGCSKTCVLHPLTACGPYRAW
jgi:hypothetical protein